jgi:AraC-like DNA-binding protein
MSVSPARRLTANQIAALRFAARRQLARWSNKTGLSPRQQAQRAELRRAADILKDDALALIHRFVGGSVRS